MLPRLPVLQLVGRVAALLIIATIGFALPARAQSDGVIQGTIQDAQSAVLPGVAMTLRNSDTGVTRSTVSEADGQYRFGGLPSGTKAEQKSPGAGQSQRAEENTPGQKSKGMSSENKKGPPDNMKAGGREDRNASGAAESKQPGRETEKNAQTQGRETEKNAQTRGRESEKNAQTQGNRENMQAQGHEGRETNQNAQSREGRTNMNAQGRTESDTTVGQAGAGAKLSTEQRTRITTIIRDEHVAPVNNVDFAVSVGTRVPRESVHLQPLPSQVVTVYPEWRGYEFFLVHDQIVVVDPRTLEIVDVFPA